MPERSPRRFEQLLPGDPAAYRDDTSSIFGVWPDFRLAWVNRGYLDFAAGNEGPDVEARWNADARLWEAVGEPLTAFYRPRFERLLREGGAWSHRYECSSPDRYRVCRMTVTPVGRRDALLVVNSILGEVEHACTPAGPGLSYVGPEGLVRMCANCRRVQRAGGEAWDWVPDYVKRPPRNVTHGLCPLCLQWRYGDYLRARRAMATAG